MNRNIYDYVPGKPYSAHAGHRSGHRQRRAGANARLLAARKQEAKSLPKRSAGKSPALTSKSETAQGDERMKNELYKKETTWGVHRVTAGYGKNAGKFIAESSGWGGARGYFRVFDSVDEAKSFVDSQTKPMAAKPIVL